MKQPSPVQRRTPILFIPWLLAVCAVLGALGNIATAFAVGSFTVVRPGNTTAAPTNPANYNKWGPANVRNAGTVAITTAKPRGTAPNNLGSLEFTQQTSADKADYVQYWGVVSGRTLGNIDALSYEWYRDSSSTNPALQVPALRIAYLTANNESGYLIYEPGYTEFASTAPTNTWNSSNALNGNFWMRAFGPGRTIDDYNVTLAEWQANADEEGTPIDDDSDSDAPHVLSASTNIVGIEVGIGSGWNGAFTGFVDNVAIGWGSDSVSANFEPTAQCTTICYADVVNGNDANGGTSPSDAKKTIQAAVNQVSSGGRVLVAPGTYPEAVDVAKPVSLEGAQQGVLAKGRTGDQSIIKPTTNDVAIELRADNITVDGFVFDMSDVNSPWAITGVTEPGDSVFANVEIVNNEFKGRAGDSDANQDGGGVYMWTSQDVVFEGNFFNDTSSHAVFMGNSSDGTVYRNNDSFSNAFSGFSVHVGPHTDVLVENNRAVDDSLVMFKANGAVIKNNSFKGSATTSSRIYLGGGNERVEIANNTIVNGRNQAVYVLDGGFGYGANKAVTVIDNTITVNASQLTLGFAIIDLRDVGGSSVVSRNKIDFNGSLPTAITSFQGIALRGDTGSVEISSNELNGNNVDTTASDGPSIGISLRDSLATSTKVTITNNKIAGFITAIGVDAIGASPEISAGLNSLLGSTNGLTNTSTTVTVAAEQNWWGSATGPTNAGNPGGTGRTVVGQTDYNPWLCDGTDTSTAIGFQPNISLCGIATKLVFTTQPGDGQINQPLSTQPVVQAQDADGNPAPGFTSAVTLTLGTNPSGATLGGTTVVNAVNGVATFNNISVNRSGTGYTLVARSNVGNVTSAPFNVTLSSPIIARINSGGPAVTVGGIRWSADTNFSGGKPYRNSQVTRDPGGNAIYRDVRQAGKWRGSFSYTIPVPEPGTYEVRLHFAEIWWGAPGGKAGGFGKRVFSVGVEGTTQLNNYDIATEVPPLTPVVKSFVATVNDGQLNLNFGATVDEPLISAIEVIRTSKSAAANYGIQFSTSNNRSNPRALGGATVRGNIFAFVPNDPQISRVRFWLNNPNRTGSARMVETTAPWDFAGTVNGVATPFNTASLPDGLHTITVEVVQQDGTARIAHAQFRVDN